MPGVATDQVRRTFVVLVVLHSSRYCLQKITLEFVKVMSKVLSVPFLNICIQEAQLSLTNRVMLQCKVVEVWQDFLSEYVDKKFTYICYRRLIRHD